MFVTTPVIREAILNAWARYVEFHARAPFKHLYLAWIGLVTFPTYFVVWTYLFPQPYESFWLRALGCAVCVATLVRDRWPEFLKRYYYPISYILMMGALPVFFTYMALMNGANTPWLMSTMAALLFVALVYDIVNVFVVTIVGSIIGILAFYFSAGLQPLPINYVLCFPILLFAVIAVVFLAYSERLIADEQYSAARQLASNIAHEMRTPLLGIRLDCERVAADLTLLQEHLAQRTGGEFGDRERQMLAFMLKALKRIDTHASSGNHVINMLLANVSHRQIAKYDSNVYCVHRTIETALDRYPFRGTERSQVNLPKSEPLYFRGSDTLLIHVFFNLLKNSLKAIEKKGNGDIEIAVSRIGERTRIEFRDTGIGIPTSLLPFVFIPFVTGGNSMHGTGIGLAFSKLVVESFGGTMTCTSCEGVGTTFVITLPQHQLPEASELAEVATGIQPHTN